MSTPEEIKIIICGGFAAKDLELILQLAPSFAPKDYARAVALLEQFDHGAREVLAGRAPQKGAADD